MYKKRSLLMGLALLLALTMFPMNMAMAEGELELKPLHMTMFADEETIGVAPEDILTPIWREKTQITWDVVADPQTISAEQWIQMQMVADTLPELIATHELPTVAIEALINADKVYEITEEDIRTYMPKFTKRVEDLGLTLDVLISSNLASDGKLYNLPCDVREVAFPALRSDIRAVRDGCDSPYSLYLRDDILKQIFPDARTEAELGELYVQNEGKLTMEEAFGDIPITNMDELHEYLIKVKELGLKVGEKDVIPAQLTVSSSVGSTLWSLQTAMGIFWQDGFGFKDDKLMHVQSSDVYKEYIRNYNTFNTEGLIDREAWIMKDDQIKAKVINGEYAVINYWLPVNEARQVAKDENRGYGYRLLPAFAVPLNNEYQNLLDKPITLNSMTKVMLLKTISPEDKAQVFNWLDWNMSYEADELRNWGLPEWSTGEGSERRFTPEYSAIEAWSLYGEQSEKDGSYYGLLTDYSRSIFKNQETHKLGLSGNYNKPRWIYPPEIKADQNLDTALFEVIREYYGTQINFYAQIGWSVGTDITNDPVWKEVNAKLASPENDGRLANAMICAPEEFDAKYQEYYDNAYPTEFQEALEDLKLKWKTIYDEKAAPEIEKAKALKEAGN